MSKKNYAQQWALVECRPHLVCRSSDENQAKHCDCCKRGEQNKRPLFQTLMKDIYNQSLEPQSHWLCFTCAKHTYKVSEEQVISKARKFYRRYYNTVHFGHIYQNLQAHHPSNELPDFALRFIYFITNDQEVPPLVLCHTVSWLARQKELPL